jgi:hypothetical protein
VLTPALIGQIIAATIGASGAIAAGALSRAYDSARRSNNEKQALQKEVSDTASGLKAVVEKLDEIKTEWKKDRESFHRWQLRVEQRLAHVEGRNGIQRAIPETLPVWDVESPA